jgi:hypothetical protein
MGIVSNFAGLARRLTSPSGGEEKNITDTEIFAWELSPTELKKGETILLSGNTQPLLNVRLDVAFEITVPVRDGRYEQKFGGVNISPGPNRFTVEAFPAEDMDFTVRMLIPFKKHRSAAEGKAVYVDSNVPAGNYNIVVSGIAEPGTAEVRINIRASQTIEADEKGFFRYEYDTSPFPPCMAVICIGKEKKEVTIVP